MTTPTPNPPYQPWPPQPAPAQQRNRAPWIVATAALAIAIVAVGAAVALFVARGSVKLDDHAQASCQYVRESSTKTNLIDAVVVEIKAVSEAQKSSVPELQQAGTKTSPASSLPTGDPNYLNPGDVQFNAVATWCRKNT